MVDRVETESCRQLVVVLGDQLNADSAVFDGFDRHQDVVWMAEVAEESTHVWSHKARIAVFLAGMRNFSASLERRNFRVDYHRLDARGNQGTLADELESAIRRLKPQRLVMALPGDWRVKRAIEEVAGVTSRELDIRPDRYFFSTPEQFALHAKGRKQLRSEYFYRQLRREHDILMEGQQPVGGKWNYDGDNRGNFGKSGPGQVSDPVRFKPNAITREVLELVDRKFANHPGNLSHFDWPVTSRQARRALDDFVAHRLPQFGLYQDAMWTDQPYLYHSRISAALNLKLLDPRDAIDQAVVAYHTGKAPLNAVEGFVRQILGWREYVRGVYWLLMPEYLTRNQLVANQPLPDFYWTADTDMHCLHHSIRQTLDYGYAHHIQRLMVTGLFALLLGVNPRAVHEWYLAVYVDAVEWVELPNSLGMSQFADGGVMASKPYVATGKYIQRMSNYCQGCRFDPALATGEEACPFTTLYWDFLRRHRGELEKNPRMKMQLRNLQRKTDEEIVEIGRQTAQLRAALSDSD